MYSKLLRAGEQGIQLEHCSAVYVPGNTPEERAVVQQIAEELTALFGGATVQQVNGFWKDSAGDVISELISCVYSFHKEASGREHIKVIAQQVKESLHQERVLIELDGQAIIL